MPEYVKQGAVMTDAPNPTNPQSMPPNPPTSVPGAMGPQSAERAQAQESAEVAGGKALAIVSYVINFVGVPFFLVPFFMRNNAFSLYHSKQCLVLWIVALCFSAAAFIASFIPLVVCITVPLMILVWITLIVFNIIGLINAINAKAQPLPLFGIWGEQWFANFRKQ